MHSKLSTKYSTFFNAIDKKSKLQQFNKYTIYNAHKHLFEIILKLKFFYHIFGLDIKT